jgi:phospholipid transport system substrate-binding protein
MMSVSGVWCLKQAPRGPCVRNRPANRADSGVDAAMRRMAGVLLVLLLALGWPGGARAGPDAADKIRRFYDSLLVLMKDGPSLGFAGRYRQISPTIAETFDLPYMARASVGRYWESTPMAQQQEIVDAFGSYVTATYASRFSSYSGQRFEVLSERPYSAEMIVDSRIVKADGQSVLIRYLMRRNGSDWRIGDIYLEGTVSELATRRSEFSSTIQQHGIDGLIAGLRRKSEELTGNTP